VEPGKKKTIRHTFRIAPDSLTANSPQGFGFGTALVTGSNVVTFAGTLADGRKFSATGSLSGTGSVELFASLFAGRGALVAPLQIQDGAITGTAHWFRPSLAADPLSTEGFHATNAVTGAIYLPPARGDQNGNAQACTLDVSGGHLPAALQQELSLDPNGRITLLQTTISGLKVRLLTSTGMLSGSFQHPLGGIRNFRGAVIQSESGAWGFFTGPEEAGAVVLAPVAE
jgi:hypothetical protein